MDKELENQLRKFSPYVRFAKVNGGDVEHFYVPTRVIYDYEIILMINGELVVRTEDGQYVLNEHDLHIMSPYVLHKRFVPQGRCDYYNIHFDFMYDEVNFSAFEVYEKPCLDKLIEAPIIESLKNRNIYQVKDFNLPSKLHLPNFYEYAHICDKIIENFNQNTPQALLRLSGYMKILISMIFDSILEDTGAESYEDIMQKCQNFILENYNKEIDVVKLATHYGFSTSHFRKIFKKVTNKTLHGFHFDVRMNYAKQFLETGNYNVTEVSYMVGYDDPLYFSRAFKKKFKIPPSSFIKQSK